MLKELVGSIFIVVLFVGCNWINPDEKEPAYLYIPSLSFSAGTGNGTNSEAITEVWVYANDNMVGIFDLPASVPILNDGNTDIKIFAGIKNNGIASTRIRYPFFTVFDTTLNFTSLQTDTIIPHFTYDPSTVITEKGFEGGNFLVPYGANSANFSTTNNAADVFEGNRSGYGYLPAGGGLLFFKDDTNLSYQSGQNVFMELNYSCNNTFAVGFIVTSQGSVQEYPALIINPSVEGDGQAPIWKKIYIDFGYILLQNPNAQYVEWYVKSAPANADTPIHLFLDNLKWVSW
jgi:hypothetical protein